MDRSSCPARRLLLALLVLTLLAPTPRLAAADDHALTARIDHWITAGLRANHVTPVPRADDAEFIRRVFLDLAGRIPSILEVRDFLDDDRRDKRRLWVERLLAGDRYAEHFANVWRATLLPTTPDTEEPAYAQSFEAWLRNRLRRNVGYDVLVREILTGSGRDDGSSPGAFYQANENKPTNLAANTSRLFLGVNLQCAQCHAHPFARWTRTQFWEYAAFFADVGAPEPTKAGAASLEIPGTGKTVRARFPLGKVLEVEEGVTPRVALAKWMTAADNPFFARAAVNRVWAYFFGLGLIEPLDETGPANPPSHPELLDELARAFASHHYDLKYLVRAIVASQAYQRTSAVAKGKEADVRLLGYMPLRALSAEQLFDTLAAATEYREPTSVTRRGDGEPLSARAVFRAQFRRAGKRTEPTTTVLQALFLMNGKFMAAATSLEGNRTLATIAEASATSTARQVDTLFLVALSRRPRPKEAARLIRYVERGGPSGDRKKALADVFWALLNSSEFSINH